MESSYQLHSVGGVCGAIVSSMTVRLSRSDRTMSGHSWTGEPMAETTSGEGAWLRAAAAAEHLGISERTVRRQAIEGLLTGRRVRSARGHVWEVWIDGVAAPRPVTGRSRPDTAGHVRDADTARVDD